MTGRRRPGRGHDSVRRNRPLGRRRLISGAAALGGAYLLGTTSSRLALGAPDEPTDDSVVDPATDAPVDETPAEAPFNDPVRALEQAERGEQEQLREPPPRPVNRWQPGQFITHVDVVGRRMALTFDDGPSPSNTPLLLSHLRNYGVRATFYLVGVNVRSFPDWARRIVDEGHELGNHSIYHTPYSAAPLAGQMAGNQSIIRDVTGVTPVTHRAPGLTRGGIILGTARSIGVYEAHTHMSTFDWISPRYSASAIFSQFVRHHRNGALALYHDGGGRRPTPDAIPSIIEYARGIGYTFVTATELVNSGTPRPASFSYFSRSDPSSRAGTGRDEGAESDSDGDAHVDLCGYDAAAGLRAILDDGSSSYVERMRVVESLAELESLAAD